MKEIFFFPSLCNGRIFASSNEPTSESIFLELLVRWSGCSMRSWQNRYMFIYSFSSKIYLNDKISGCRIDSLRIHDVAYWLQNQSCAQYTRSSLTSYRTLFLNSAASFDPYILTTIYTKDYDTIFLSFVLILYIFVTGKSFRYVTSLQNSKAIFLCNNVWMCVHKSVNITFLSRYDYFTKKSPLNFNLN